MQITKHININIPEAIREYVFIEGDEQTITKIYYHNSIVTQSVWKTFKEEIKSQYPYASFQLVDDISIINEKKYGVKKKQIKSNNDEEIIRFIRAIILDAYRQNASDIHIEVQDTLNVFFRVNGFLIKTKYSNTREIGRQIISAIYNNAVGSSHTTYSEYEYQFAKLPPNADIIPPNVGIEAIRVQTGPMHGGNFAVLRLLYKNTSFTLKLGKDLDETIKETFVNLYGYSITTAKKIKPVLLGAEGLIVISGITGSGKSTTLKLMLEFLHTIYPDKAKFTIEDPPEYIIKGAKQLPVPENRDFDEILKVAMRADPDIIMIGEVRDSKTAETIKRAVLTGHQSFTTVHARDISTIFNRFADLGIDLEELIESKLVKLLISQRLIPRLCNKCKKPKELYNGLTVYEKGDGCEACKFTGIAGRVVIEECLNFEDLAIIESPKYIRNYLTEKKLSMKHKAIEYIKKGIVSIDHVRQFIDYISEEEIENA
ncbi:MAG: GspE/PulE family protein [Thermoprotei archaeon]